MTPDHRIHGRLFLIALCSLSSVWVLMETSDLLNSSNGGPCMSKNAVNINFSADCFGLPSLGDDLDSLQFVKSKGSAFSWQGSAARAFESWPGVAFIDSVRSIFPNHMVRVRRKDWSSRDLQKGHIPRDCLPASCFSFLVSPIIFYTKF
ncbi:uncharacterized protein TNCT_290101 [Trichonephila clavata]|uniref:Uncharacterized protein n=1 Tax=Trichonephila clavata TaxID=2740835 RepID=A0A8X6HHP7_TRICU|nr:uncharacterized protein TNCT_290101 [Trichonephila clavata]